MIVDVRAYAPIRENLPLFRIFAALGGAVVIAGAFLEPLRIWAGLLVVGWHLLGLGLAGLAFMAIQSATGAHWAVALRRVPESMAGMVPIGGMLIALAVVAGGERLYPGFAGREHLSGFQAAWLEPVFFFTRGLVYLSLWVLFGTALLRASREQDRNGSPRLARRIARLSAAFLPVFAFTLWLASVDWIGALEPHWPSTIFGVYQFAGLFLSGLAAMTVLVIRLRRSGPLAGVVQAEHLHDLGKLLFAFSTFWMYIWFSQYMLIWYGNLPEETAYFVHRQTPGWLPLFVANVLINWAIPFLVLLPRAAKRSEKVLLRVALLLLLGRAIDLYLMIYPPLTGKAPLFGGWEAGLALGALGLFVLIFQHLLASAPVVPVGDPQLAESLAHQG
jgi:hypothetical protein